MKLLVELLRLLSRGGVVGCRKMKQNFVLSVVRYTVLCYNEENDLLSSATSPCPLFTSSQSISAGS